MPGQFWISLPVRDIKKSIIFYTELGFSINVGTGNEEQVQLFIGDSNAVVLLVSNSLFKQFTQHEIADTNIGSEVLFSIHASSRNDVDSIANKVERAGGRVFSKPAEHQGWMYGCGFADLDGHRWNMMYMDMDRMKKA